MKAREQRKRVTTPARIRTDSGWADVTIRDISSRGIGLRSPRAPRRGDYVELCRHHHRLIGRVMWSDGECFGVLLSDAISVNDLLTSRPGRRNAEERRLRPRRSAAALRPGPDPRVAIVSVAQGSQNASRRMHFVAVAAIAGIGAFLVADLASNVLSQALESVSAGLIAGGSDAAADRVDPPSPLVAPQRPTAM